MSLEFMIPRVFERYFLIRENHGIIDEYPFEALPETASDQEQENRYKIEKSYELLLRNTRNPDSLYRPISLKELAARLNTRDSAHMLDHIKHSPGFTTLWNLTVENLTRFIQRVRNQETLCFYIDDFNLYPKDWPNKRDEEAKERNEIGDIREYFKFQERSGMDACSYLFPKENQWCLSTFEDLRYFILGCDNKTAEQLASVDGLEYFEISRDYCYK